MTVFMLPSQKEKVPPPHFKQRECFMNVHVFLLVFLLIFALALLCALCWPHPGPALSGAAKVRTALPRLLKPRSPHDCPACRLASTASSVGGPVSSPVRPWREVKSRRGAPKRIPTEGFACPNRQCRYFGNTDAHFHALVGDGKHGHAEQIQTFRCQACRTTFSARRDTPMYRLKTPSHQVAMVRISRWLKGWTRSRGLAGLPLSTSHDYQVAHTRWRARTHPARALLLPSVAPAPATGRTANQAAQP